MNPHPRYARLVRIYAIAGVVTLALYAWVNALYLDRWRTTAVYDASLSFEETVRAVDTLSQALDRSLYATDGAMCARVCSEAYAAASAAESAMATLPFSTQELEHLSAFLNQAGDYAHTLCAESAESGFTAEQRETLKTLCLRADEFVQTLRGLREGLNGGALRMDSREQRLRNVGSEPGEALSARLLQYEASFAEPAELRYDGKYGAEEPAESGFLTEEEMRLRAADFLGVAPEELESCYEYEGLGGRRCFRCGDTFLCVSRSGVESLSQTRLVSEALLDEQEAVSRAEDYLRRAGYTGLRLEEQRTDAAVSVMRFARTEGDAVWIDNCLSLGVALDDGSLYSFNLADYSPGESGVSWALDEQRAAAALPQGFAPTASGKVILTSEGGRHFGCYEFSGRGERGENVRICVDAADGAQRRITVEV